MSKINSIHPIDLSVGTAFPIYIKMSSIVAVYKIYGTTNIDTDVTIGPAQGDVIKTGMSVCIDYSAVITGTGTVTIFGTVLPVSLRGKKLKIFIECEFLDDAFNPIYHVYILPSAASMPYISLEALDTTIVDGVTLDANATGGKFQIKDEGISAAKLASDSVETVKIKNKAVLLSKFQDILRGYLLSGGESDSPTLFNAKSSHTMVVGNGTDVKSVLADGDISMSVVLDDGLNWVARFVIGAEKVLSGMIKPGELTDTHFASDAAIALSKLAALTSSMILVSDGNGTISSSGIASTKLAALDITTPGTPEALKALILDALGKLSELDVTNLKLNGIAVTATATELNTLHDGSGGSLQTFLDITGNTSPTVALLKNVYYADTTAGNITLTLPLAASVRAGFPVRLLYNEGDNTAKAVTSGSDTFVISSAYSLTSGSIQCASKGKGFTVTSDGVSKWICTQYDY